MISEAFAKRTQTELDVLVHPDVLPQSTSLPCIVYTMVSRPSFQGVAQRLPFEVVRIQVDIYGKNANDVELLGDKLLDLWRGTTGAIDGLVGERINKCYPAEDSYSVDYLPDNVRPLWTLNVDLFVEILID